MVQELEREAGEVEVPQGKHSKPPTALAEHGEEHDNKVGAHKVVHATMLAVEPPPNDAALGMYHPPPPPICNTAQTPQGSSNRGNNCSNNPSSTPSTHYLQPLSSTPSMTCCTTMGSMHAELHTLTPLLLNSMPARLRMYRVSTQTCAY